MASVKLFIIRPHLFHCRTRTGHRHDVRFGRFGIREFGNSGGAIGRMTGIETRFLERPLGGWYTGLSGIDGGRLTQCPGGGLEQTLGNMMAVRAVVQD